MKIDSLYKLILAVIALIAGFCLPEIWDFLKGLLGF